NIRLEAQVWGFEMGGFYRFLGGLPPITNLVNPNNAGPNRFKAAMDQLFNLTIIPIITTDPLRANFDRRRFRGHLALQIDNTWDYQIVAGFPSEIVSKLAAKVTTTTAQTLWDSGNRVFLMKPGYQQADSLRGQAKYRWNGTVDTNKEGLTRFRGLEQYSICPTPVVESLYLDQWLKSNSMDPGGVFDHGSRLLEFMKHGYWQHYCYQKGHSHTGPRAQYDGVIGFGAWYVKRLQKILDGVYSRGLSVYPSFSLTNEFVFTEALVPYFDEFYDHATSSASVFSGDTRSLELLRLEGKPRTRQAVPLFQFIYSEKVTAKMNIIEDDPLSMPGYKEVKKSTAPPVAEPTYMLREAMDDEVPSFSAWQSASRAYFEQTFDRNATQNGLAPLGYATNEGGIYTYNRCVQDVMNLRSRIFRFGAGAVRGERIILPASWIDEPYDYNVPAIEMAKRCAQMQIFFAKYFRLGYMLGQTQIVSGNKSLSALRIRRRNFSDVNELVKVLYTQQEVGGQVKINISDSESRGIDKERIAPLGNYQYQPWEEDQKNTSNPIHTDKIQHMIWQSTKVMAGQTRNLYVFANVGNRDATIEFLYSRGFSGSTPMNRTIRVFNGNPNPAASATRSVKVGDTEAGLFIARRSLVAVEIVP
ncbi:MAG TPA: hypothetical protein VJQ56_09295, partial [Blastocatellia bacterium]|nr:hypothetical protein [Blastocatellia bacterium]